ncbi:uncharacterized protein LOC8263272 [Ricinus communis]|uniref:ATP binding protein, putative n=1 Tax=Ricinus communis TaxID=3988 RepID=B9SKC5_RICCO|nr:uncharacterized protein LOC8263272 [Ricinus communis]XP_015579194.1 uncharacterized protein LOC8263272 [Ricinus communis]XP_048232095.1 uncharacterized protein LOC8263272 [Ricinus communis]EEF35939.1 ATP binding protein, putative [Ricinus communis]|eukprot:XP_002526444.1 uncharacterized protein LOC8263272 [Ricinus communis]
MADEAVASGGASGGGGGEEVGTSSSSGGSSPKNRMKFLCSYGGKILPRPADGLLKYVGGETRVIGVPRDTNFSELMKKLKSEFEGDMVLKYQVMPEELDVLVSVRTDEDLKHMLDEYDRHESGGTSKLRAFLFPSTPVILENQNGPADPHAVEQRYIDAINNTVRSANCRPPTIIANRPSFSLSASSSPKGNSPDGNTMDATTHEHIFMNSYHSNRFPMHKVHSSPSLYNLNAPHHQSNSHGNPHYYQHHHHHQQYQQHYPHSYQSSSRLPHEPQRLLPSLSLGRPDFGRTPFSPLNQYHSNVNNAGSSNVHNNWSSSGHNFGSGSLNRHSCYEEQHSGYGCRTIERLDGLSPSPKNKILE